MKLRFLEDSGLITGASAVAGAFGAASRLFFPPRCVGCEGYLKNDALVCERCRHAVFPIESPICTVCGVPRRPQVGRGYAGIDAVCGRCAEHRPRYTRARALWEYSGSIADAIQRAKYGGHLWVLRALARELGPWLLGEIEAIAIKAGAGAETVRGDSALLLTTVPMHPKDLRKRGFDLPYLLLSQCLNSGPNPYGIDDLIRKDRQTPQQAGLDYVQRQVNLRRAFSCHEKADIMGRAVVLFDDVITTGATAHEAAKTLRKAGAGDVFVLSAARAVAQ